MASRVMGFVRELVTSFYFGAGAAADAFIAALTIPTLFRDILGEDVVERSFMPGVREELSRKNYQRAWHLASASLTWMILGMVVIGALVWCAAPWLVKIVAQGIHQRQVDEGTFADTVQMTRILVPFLMFIALAAFVGGLLYYGFDQHLPYSFAPISLSVGVITMLVLFNKELGIYALAWGFVIGAAFQFLVQLPFLRRRCICDTEPAYKPTLRFPAGTSRRISRETLFVTIQSVLTKTTEVVDRRVASFLAPGSISSLWFAARLTQLPFAIFAISIARAVTPHLSERIGVGDKQGFREGVLIGYRYNLVLMLPITALLIVLADPIVRLVFERGEFGNRDVAMTALAFACYAVGLLGMSLYTFGSRVCSTLGRNNVATVTAAVGGAVNIYLNYVLSATVLRHGGLALATSIGFTVNSALLFLWLHRHLRRTDSGFTAREFFAPMLRVGINATVAGCVTWLVFTGFVQRVDWLIEGWLVPKLFAVCIPLALGGGVYVVASLVNPVPEIQPLIRRVKKRLRG